MTDETISPSDCRRALAMIRHHARHYLAGVKTVLQEAIDAGRATHLLIAILDSYDTIVPIFRTESAMPCLAQYVEMIAEHFNVVILPNDETKKPSPGQRTSHSVTLFAHRRTTTTARRVNARDRRTPSRHARRVRHHAGTCVGFSPLAKSGSPQCEQQRHHNSERMSLRHKRVGGGGVVEDGWTGGQRPTSRLLHAQN